jgi:hypothetical protein
MYAKKCFAISFSALRLAVGASPEWLFVFRLESLVSNSALCKMLLNMQVLAVQCTSLKNQWQLPLVRIYRYMSQAET